MGFNSSLREVFPFLASLFPENNSNNSCNFPLGDGSPSSRALVHNSLNHDHDVHNPISPPSVNNNSSLLNNPHHFDQFSIEGSSKNPLFGDSNTCTDPFIEPYSFTNGFANDPNAYYPSLSFTVPDHNTTVNSSLTCQGFQNQPDSWDHPQNIASTQPLLPPEIDDHRTFQQQPNQPLLPPPRMMAANVPKEVSCIDADENGHNNDQDKVDEITDNSSRIIKTKRFKRTAKKTNVIKGQWTSQEDELLMNLVARHGTKKWSQIAKLLNGRVGKQCRERWYNHLRPDIKKDSWSEEEDKILIETHKEIGNKWAAIAKRLPGRTENTIKNHWNATKRRQYSRRRRDGNNAPKCYLLQNYINSLSSTTPTSITSSGESDNDGMVYEISNPETNSNPHMVQIEYSNFNLRNWNIEAFNNHINRQRLQQQQMDFTFDANGYNHQRNHTYNASFGSILREDCNPIENFELPMEMDSLRNDMDLLEMIRQGNL